MQKISRWPTYRLFEKLKLYIPHIMNFPFSMSRIILVKNYTHLTSLLELITYIFYFVDLPPVTIRRFTIIALPAFLTYPTIINISLVA